MNNITVDELSEKLKTVPQNILDDINDYLDSQLELNRKSYKITEEQQSLLDSMVEEDESEYLSAESFYEYLKKKHEL